MNTYPLTLPIAFFALIGMLAVAFIVASVLTPILLLLMEKGIYLLAKVLSAIPPVRNIMKRIIDKSSPTPYQKTHKGKTTIYIPKPIQYLCGIRPPKTVKGDFGNVQVIDNFNGSNSKPLPKNTFNMVSQPVVKKTNFMPFISRHIRIIKRLSTKCKQNLSIAYPLL